MIRLLLLNPIILSTLILTAVNDHYLKIRFPGVLTGKISDFAGLFYFPFFIYAVIFFREPLKKIRIHVLMGIIVMTDVLFVSLKLTPLSVQFATWFSLHFFPISITRDASDLWALSSNIACFYYAKVINKKITAESVQ